MTSTADRLRAAVQAVLDEDPDGWVVGHFVLAMGLEKIHAGGWVESTAWYYTPPGQAEWMTDGLLEAAVEMRACAEAAD